MASDRSGWSSRGAGPTTQPANAALVGEARDVVGDRYELEQLVGSGGMGVVFRAFDRELDEHVALKVLDGGASSRALVRREVKLARRVTHAHVVRVHDLGSLPDGRLFLTMEFVDGASLRALLSEGALLAANAAVIGWHVARGLAEAHRAGVVHGDVKAANVLVKRRSDGAPHALLSDFGIARARHDGDSTMRGAGTPAYMAPEQRSGAPADERSDVFALGLLLCQLFSGERWTAARAADEAAVRAACDAMPAGLGALVTTALAEDPARRRVTAEDLAGALAPAAGGSGRLPAPSARNGSLPGGPRIAVAPFRSAGSTPADAGLDFAEELVRVLSTLRDARVFGASAMASGRDDPLGAARRLGADVLVDGTVHVNAAMLRVSVSLAEVTTGLALWSARFEGRTAELLAWQATIAARVGESLRVDWLSLDAAVASPQTIDAYLLARRRLREAHVVGHDGAIALLEQCVEQAPDFQPAVAAYAIACCRAWFLPSAAREPGLGARSAAAARRAQELAPSLAESHLAGAMVASQEGDYARAMRDLRAALQLAPTMPEAHEYLGRILAEAGRPEEALEHLGLALELEPDVVSPRIYIARYHALRGDRTAVDALTSSGGFADVMFLAIRLRVAVWFADDDAIRRCLAEAERVSVLRDEAALIVALGRYALGDSSPEAIDAQFVRMIPSSLSPRVLGNMRQTMVEAHGARGAIDRALAHLTAAADGPLVDVDWLDRCPALAPLRSETSFERAAAAIRRRAERLWLG